MSVVRKIYYLVAKKLTVDMNVALNTATSHIRNTLATIGSDHKNTKSFHILELFINFVLINKIINETKI